MCRTVRRVFNSLDKARQDAVTKLAGEVFHRKGRVRLLQKSNDLHDLMGGNARLGVKPEVMFCGESSSGKSSLLRAVFGSHHRLFLSTGKEAGTTTTISKYDVNGVFSMVDTPGYGYVSAFKRSKNATYATAETEAITHRYISLASGSMLHRVYLLVPATTGHLQPQDSKLLSACAEYGVPATVIVSKCDLIAPMDVANTFWTIKNQVPQVDLIPFSTRDPHSVTAVQVDVVHAITKWLGMQDLNIRKLQELRYTHKGADEGAVNEATLKHRRNLTAHEEGLVARRAAGITVEKKLWKYVERHSKLDAERQVHERKVNPAKFDLSSLVQESSFMGRQQKIIDKQNLADQKDQGHKKNVIRRGKSLDFTQIARRARH